jgi:hypothetical protein
LRTSGVRVAARPRRRVPARVGGTALPYRAPRGILLLAILLPVALLMVIRLWGSVPRAEIEVDAFYHVRMADLCPELCLARRFPAMTMSVWQERFYDKELLFHVALAVIRRGMTLAGLDGGPPFHGLALAIGAAVIATVASVLVACRAPYPIFFTLLLVVISPFFTYRVLMVRPHNVGLIFITVYVWQIARLGPTRWPWQPFVLGWLAAYAYSTPHFLLLPAAAHALLRWRPDGNRVLAVPIATAAGIVAGFALHPQVPNTFLLWKIQALDVGRQMLGGQAPVSLGWELTAPEAGWIGQNGGAFVLGAVAVAAWLWLARRQPEAIGVDTRLFLVVGLTFLVGVFAVRRNLEYACVALVCGAALLARDVKEAGILERSGVRRLGPLLLPPVGALVLWAAIASVTVNIARLKADPYPAYDGFARWASHSLPAGTRVANVFWSDFPALFYSAPQYRYLMGLDPMFGYAAMPEQVEALERFTSGERLLWPADLRRLTGGRIAFVSVKGAWLARSMEQSGYAVVYRGDDGIAFDLGREG